MWLVNNTKEESSDVTATAADDNNQNQQILKASGRFSEEQVRVLQRSFKRQRVPSQQEKAKLREETGLTTKQISTWFTNQRRRCHDTD